jgi:hypothetical protein
MDGCNAPGADNNKEVGNSKQAIVACTFLMYIIYNAAVIIAYVKKDSEVSGSGLDTSSILSTCLQPSESLFYSIRAFFLLYILARIKSSD